MESLPPVLETYRAVSAARTTDPSSKTINELIESCELTQEAFRSAAQAVASNALKQLFGLYAQQRSRFATELSSLTENSYSVSPPGNLATNATGSEQTDPIRTCLAREKGALAAYRRALSERTLPTKARFLVSAQLALLERVHHRMEGIENRGGTTA